MIPWLEVNDTFPAVHTALREPNGLLCAGADLSPQRLLRAYSLGIFPWFNEGEPILWWSPDPRMVLIPAEMKISRSLAKTLRRSTFEIRLDTAFDQVMSECAAPRSAHGGTWISPRMRAAYGRLHELGHAHSVESWRDGKLAGGLYGVALGRVFYGESMFCRETDASKVALAHLARYLEQAGFAMIDCQMTTDHLASLGGKEIPRAEFTRRLRQNAVAGTPSRWPEHAARKLFASQEGGT